MHDHIMCTVCEWVSATVGMGVGHEGERQKRLLKLTHRALANKHRYILGKDLSHGKWVFLALALGPADTPLLLPELAILVLFAPLLASRRPDKRRRYKLCGNEKFELH